jgi:hypothetical protein
MRAAFDLGSSAPQVVSGVQQANAPQGGVGSASLEVLNGLAEFGSRKIREAAKVRYERDMMDGAMAYQQGVAQDELEVDGNKWQLEGYRTMEAETVASALYSAQQQEITNGLYEADPDTFRQNYTARLEQALTGKDERTQELINKKMVQQMPALVEQHTREHAQFQQRKTEEALATSVDVISRDPGNAQSLIDFATGASPASQGLGEEARRKAVVDGVVRAYTNGNPMAFTILDQQGVFDSMSPQEIGAMRSAQAQYENRRRTERNDAFMFAEDELIRKIQNNELSAEEGLAEYTQLMTEHGMTVTAAEASNVFATGRGAEQHHNRAVKLEIETAKLNGDYERIAEVTYNYAQDAANPSTPGKVYDYNIPVQFSMGPKRPNPPRNELTSLVAAAAESVLGAGGKVVVTSGQEDEGHQHGSNRHKTGFAGDFAFYRADGTKIKADDPEMVAIADAAASRGATGIGFGAEYMGGEHAHIDLVGTKGGGGNLWASGAKANANTLMATIGSVTNAKPLGDIDPQKWATIVKQFNGDTEMAAVAYTMGSDAAMTWNETGRRTADLDPDVAGFVERLGGSIEGRAYVTAESRAAEAQTRYELARERTAIDVYAAITPQLDILDKQYVDGGMSEQDYRTQRTALMNQYDVALTRAEVDHVIKMSDQRAQNAKIISEQVSDSNYAINLDQFAGERSIADAGLASAVAAIDNMVQPEGVSDADFKLAQDQAIQLALDEYTGYMSNAAASLGIKPEHSGIGDTISKVVKTSVEAAKLAADNRRLNAEAARATQTGTLGQKPANVQELAWKQAQETARAATENFARTNGPNGQPPSAEEVADFNKLQLEKFFVQANYVPENIRTEASAVLRGKLVQDDGTVSQHALDTIIAYRDLKAQSSTAANQMLDADARLVADAALLTAGNNPNALGRVVLDMWAKGLGAPLNGKPGPNFAEQGLVTKAINNALGGSNLRRVFSRVLGAQTTIDGMELSNDARTTVGTMLDSQIKKLHALNPNLDPVSAAKVAEETVVRSIAPLDTRVQGGDGSAQGPGSIGLAARAGVAGLAMATGNVNLARSMIPEYAGQNNLLVDASGGDLMEQMFSGQADAYRSDPLTITKAISGYVASPEFKAKYGDMTPNVGAMQWLYESIPGVADEMSTAQSLGKPMFQVHHVGQGKIMFDFTINGDGVTIPKVIPMSEIGEWYKKQDMRNITK